jgi:hypothetical protein
MDSTDFIAQRLANQRLTLPELRTPAHVVRWLGAAQAQEYAGAKWSLAQRMPQQDHTMIEAAFTAGDILRTHVMRPTWHFVAREDIRWLLELTAARVQAINATMYRRLELDEALLRRAAAAFEAALEGGQALTRVQLARVLAQAGIPAQGLRMVYFLMHAELQGLLCSGPRQGKQFSYALLRDRAPHARILSREEALALLTRRFFSSHGPALLKDFSWWSGLTLADARIGVELARADLLVSDIDGRSYYRPAAAPDVAPPSAFTCLLQPYDEYTVGYREHWPILAPDHRQQMLNGAFYGIVLIDGQVAGSWKRTLKAKQAHFETNLFRPLTADEQAALHAAAQRYAAFHGVEAVI